MKAAFELGEATQRLRIESGIRDPEQWVKKRARCRGEHAGASCRGCYEAITRNASMVWEEDLNCYSQPWRHRYWHLDCHPDWINREFDRLRRRVTKQLDSRQGLWGITKPAHSDA
jgi:hypothetical protein